MKLVDVLTIGTVVTPNVTQPGVSIGGNMAIDWSVICVIINFWFFVATK